MKEYFQKINDGYIISKQYVQGEEVYKAWTPDRQPIETGSWKACTRAIRNHKREKSRSLP